MNCIAAEPAANYLEAQFFSLEIVLSVMNGISAGDLKHL